MDNYELRYASEKYVDEKIVQSDMKEHDPASGAYVKNRWVGYERYGSNAFTIHTANREQITPNEFCVLPLVTTTSSVSANTWKRYVNYTAIFGRTYMDMVLYFSFNGETIGMSHNLYMQSANATMIDDNNYKIVVKLPPLFYIYVIVDIGTLPEGLANKFQENGIYLVCEDGHTVDQATWYFIKVELLRRVKLSEDFIQDTIARTADVEALSEAIDEKQPKTLVVKYTPNEDGTCTTDRSAEEIIAHLKKGGESVMYAEFGTLKAINFDENLATVWYAVNLVEEHYIARLGGEVIENTLTPIEVFYDPKAIPLPSTAQVGQMIMVSRVDENGVITAVKAVDEDVFHQLTDVNTGKKYRLTVVDGNLTMTEVASE